MNKGGPLAKWGLVALDPSFGRSQRERGHETNANSITSASWWYRQSHSRSVYP